MPKDSLKLLIDNMNAYKYKGRTKIKLPKNSYNALKIRVLEKLEKTDYSAVANN